MSNSKILFVVPECFVDTNLIEYLLGSCVNHQHSCSNVVGRLDNTFKDRFAIGLIDKDKVEMGYLSRCHILAETEHLTVLRHNERVQYLITVAPAIDKFILDCAKEQGVRTEDFGIPSKLEELLKISKKLLSNRDSRFKNLFVAIKRNPEIISLKKTLKYLCETQYDSKDDKVKELFSGVSE